MLVKLSINKDTLEWNSDDQNLSVNEISVHDNEIFLEISYPDPEPVSPVGGPY